MSEQLVAPLPGVYGSHRDVQAGPEVRESTSSRQLGVGVGAPGRVRLSASSTGCGHVSPPGTRPESPSEAKSVYSYAEKCALGTSGESFWTSSGASSRPPLTLPWLLNEHLLGRPSLSPINTPPSPALPANMELASRTLRTISETTEVSDVGDAPTGLVPHGESVAHQLLRLLEDPGCCFLARVVSAVMVVTILVGAAGFCAATLKTMRDYAQMTGTDVPALAMLETVCISIFTIDYLCRLLLTLLVPETVLVAQCAWIGRFPGSRVAWFASRPGNIIDLLSILPYYLEKGLEASVPGLAVIRVLRLARVFRVFKLSKYAQGVSLTARVFYTSRDMLSLLLFFVVLGLLVFGSLIFYAECGDLDPATLKFMRPDLFGDGMEETPFTSIPASFWWVIVTMMTVGYGDMYPTTLWGRIIGGCVVLSGVLILAMPITVLGSNFATHYTPPKRRPTQGSSMHLHASSADIVEGAHEPGHEEPQQPPSRQILHKMLDRSAILLDESARLRLTLDRITLRLRDHHVVVTAAQ